MRPLLLALLLLPLSALADQMKTFTWNAPTTHVDNSPLLATQIAGYRLTCAPAAPGLADIPATPLLLARSFPPGSFTCTLATRHANGEISGPSNPTNFTVPPLRPNPPTSFSVD